MREKEKREMSYTKGEIQEGDILFINGNACKAIIIQDCGCMVIQGGKELKYHLLYCPKHEAALDMYEALESWKGYFFMPKKERKANAKKLLENCWTKTARALAKAEGSQEQ